MVIVTPLDVYRQLAPRYRSLAVIAANAQGLSGIEQVLTQANPALDLLGVCLLPAVESVEAGIPPEELVERHHLAALASWFAGCGAEALVLGCTHFPYFQAALAARTDLPLIDPARRWSACCKSENELPDRGPGARFFSACLAGGPLLYMRVRSQRRREGRDCRGAARRLRRALRSRLRSRAAEAMSKHRSRPIWMGTTSSTRAISTSQAAKDSREREKISP